jgi:hypothetical protein
MQKTVLIVEDEFLIAMDLQLMLEDHGWRVIGPAANVRDALRLSDGHFALRHQPRRQQFGRMVRR